MLKKLIFTTLLVCSTFAAQAESNYQIRYQINGLIDYASLTDFDEDGLNKTTGTPYDEEGLDVNGEYQVDCEPYLGQSFFRYRWVRNFSTYRYFIDVFWDADKIYENQITSSTQFPTLTDFQQRTAGGLVIGGYRYTHEATELKQMTPNGYSEAFEYAVCRQKT